MTKVVWWIKRDIRLLDNEALHEALSCGGEVLPFFLYEPPGSDHSHFHLEARRSALAALRASLVRCGAELAFLHGDAVKAFSELKGAFDYSVVVSHQETGLNYTFERDKKLKELFKSLGVVWRETQYCSIVRGLKDKSLRGKAWNQYIEASELPKPKSINLSSEAREFASNTNLVEALKGSTVQLVTEEAAQKTLNSFLTKRSKYYSKGISKPELSRTTCSRLSPHLAWGTISLRTVYKRTEEQLKLPDCTWKGPLRAFVSRLHWRDHFIQRFEREVQMDNQALNPAYEGLEYDASEDLIRRFFDGTTKEPLVDACMRALNETGYLNFRMRAMLVSYACHTLRISWRLLIPELAKRFLDYEPGIHVSQIQMQAGVSGISTLRIYSPYKQLVEHDPNLVFVKKWLPEIKAISVSDLSYKPVVDSKTAVKKMKDALFAIKSSESGRRGAAAVFEKHGSTRRRAVKRPKQAALIFMNEDKSE